MIARQQDRDDHSPRRSQTLSDRLLPSREALWSREGSFQASCCSACHCCSVCSRISLRLRMLMWVSKLLTICFQSMANSNSAFFCSSRKRRNIALQPSSSFSASIWKTFLMAAGCPAPCSAARSTPTSSLSFSISPRMRARSSKPRLASRCPRMMATHSSTALTRSRRMSSTRSRARLRRASRSSCAGLCCAMRAAMCSSLPSISARICLMLLILGIMLASRCSSRCSPMHSAQSSSTHSRQRCRRSSLGWASQLAAARAGAGSRTELAAGRKERELVWQGEEACRLVYFLFKKFIYLLIMAQQLINDGFRCLLLRGPLPPALRLRPGPQRPQLRPAQSLPKARTQLRLRGSHRPPAARHPAEDGARGAGGGAGELRGGGAADAAARVPRGGEGAWAVRGAEPAGLPRVPHLQPQGRDRAAQGRLPGLLPRRGRLRHAQRPRHLPPPHRAPLLLLLPPPRDPPHHRRGLPALQPAAGH